MHKIFVLGILASVIGASAYATDAKPFLQGKKDDFTVKNAIQQDNEFAENMRGISVRMVAPASGVNDQVLAEVRAIKPVVFATEASIKNYHGLKYQSNTDAVRIAEMKKALQDDSVQVIWSLRSGYGAGIVAEELIKSPPPRTPKLFIGYGDVTALHLLFDRWGWKSIHGAMAVDFLPPKYELKNFTILGKILAGKVNSLSYMGLEAMNDKAAKLTRLDGTLTGGNIWLVGDSIGTPWQIKGDGKIIMVEDPFARGHMLERRLNHMRQAGVFTHAKALLYGTLRGTESDEKDINYALKKFAGELDIPVFRASAFGHSPRNYPLVFGAKTSISKEKDGYALTMDLSDLTKGTTLKMSKDAAPLRVDLHK